MSYPIDNQFRQPVEFASSAVSMVSAVALPFYASQFGVSPWVTGLTAASLLGLSTWRFRQGVGVMKFHMNLRWLPKYELYSEQIPWSKTEMFLGMGFWWGQQHTQRLYLARLPQNKHLRARNDAYEWARQYGRDHPNTTVTRWLNTESRWNPVSPLPPVGGDPAIHGIEPNEREMWTPMVERVGHTLVLGTTRVGKTRLAELLITQDIRRGAVTIVFDPKGDVALLKRMYAEACRAGRQKDFWFFHLGYPELSDRYSPISTIGRITEVATRIANALPGDGQSAAFKEFVWRFVNVMAKAMNLLGDNPTYESIYSTAVNIDGLCLRYFEFWLDRDHPGWREEFDNFNYDEKQIAELVKKTGRAKDAIILRQFFTSKGWSEGVADGLSSVLANDKTYFEKLVSSLYPLLEKLTTGKISELLSPAWENPNDPRRIFDWDKIMNTGGIVYVGLDSLSDFEVAGAVGNAMFADLTSTAGRRYKFGTAYGQSTGIDVDSSTKVAIHADEFNELIGDEFVPLLNKAGGAGYQVTVYTQTWSDVEAKIGNKAKADQIGGNLNTLIMLRVKNTATAEILTEQLPTVEVYSMTTVSGTSDVQNPDEFADFAARSEDRLTAREVAMIQPADLVQLPKGQAFALLEGGQLAKIRLPLPMGDDSDIHWPANLNTVFDGMQAQYQGYLLGLGEELPLDFDGTPGDTLTVEGKGHGY
jgi:conjugative coupling factor TraD (TOL family)